MNQYSYSGLSQYATCPAQYKAIRDKKFKDVPSEAATWGTAVHEAVEARLARPDQAMPEGMGKYAKPVDTIRARLRGYDLHTEVALGIGADLAPVPYDEGRLRGKIDLLAIRGTHAYVIDWKTGKVKKDTDQLRLYALLAMLNHPMVQRVTAVFVWLKFRKTTRKTYGGDDVLKFAAQFLEQAKAIDNDTTFSPRPSGLCKAWCPVLTCKHNGKRSIF